MNNLLYVLAAIALGFAASLQPPINATIARVLGSSFLAATISISISFVLISTLWLAWSKADGDFSRISQLPWWIIFGGVIGAVFVVGSIVTVPVIGVAVFFVCVVAGQLIGSTLIDQMGVFGVEVKPINATKLLGLCFVLLGAWIVQNSNG